MSFQEVGRESLYTPDIDITYAALQAKVAHHAEMNRDGTFRMPDRYFLPCLEAANIALRDSEYRPYQELVWEDVPLYPGRSLMNVVNLQARKFIDHILLTMPDEDAAHFPEGYENPEQWLALPKAITAGGPVTVYLDKQYSLDVMGRYRQTSELNVQTNHPDRGALVKLAGLLYGLGERPVHLVDAGCSRTYVGQKLAFDKRRQYPYLGISLMKPDTEGNPVEPDRKASQALHNMLMGDSNFPVASVLCIDIQNPMLGWSGKEAQLLRKWVRHCLYPSENTLRWDLDYFENMHRPEVRFVEGDLTRLDHGWVKRAYADREKADLAYMWTVAYQLGPDGTRAAIDNLKPHMKPGGKILIFDYMDIGPGGEMHFSEDWPAFSCKGYVLDLEHEEAGLQLLMTIESARARKVVLSKYAGQLAVKQGLASLVPETTLPEEEVT